MQTIKAEIIKRMQELIVQHLKVSYDRCVELREQGAESHYAGMVVHEDLRDSSLVSNCTSLIVRIAYGGE